MRFLRLILILLSLVAAVNPQAYGAPIHVDEVVISGATYTDPKLLRRYVPVTPGRPTTEPALLLAEERIDALNIAANTEVSQTYSQDGYRVLVRVNDGRGFVIEPVEFTVGSIINLMLGNLKLVYHNLGGKAINPYVEYNISSHELYLGVNTPGAVLPIYHNFGYHTADDVYPTVQGGYEVQKKEIYWETSFIPYPGWHPSWQVTHSHQRSQDPNGAKTRQWVIHDVTLPYRVDGPGYQFSLEFAYRRGRTPGAAFERRQGAVDVAFRRGQRSITIKGAVGRAYGDVPPDQLFYLGGQTCQRGYEPRAFSGTAAINTTVELAYELVADSVRIKAFAEAGCAGTSLEELSLASAKTSFGVGLDLPNPSGLLSVFLATPGEKWQPRFALRFQL